MENGEPSDEMLMRLADGEVEEPLATALRARIAGDPALAARHDAFVRTRRAAADAFAGIAAQPVPDRLLAAVLEADRAARPAAQVIPLPVRRRPPRILPLALAASVAALLAAPVGYLLGRGGDEGGMPLAGVPPLLAAALEATPSGTPRRDGATSVQPLASHEVPGGICRDFLLDAPSGATLGVACREGGAWRLRVAVRIEERDALRTASADHPVVAATLERLGAEPPMDADREAALIARGWR
jgi:anti-sigma factor RsiW